jgi:hypothetical protein
VRSAFKVYNFPGRIAICPLTAFRYNPAEGGSPWVPWAGIKNPFLCLSRARGDHSETLADELEPAEHRAMKARLVKFGEIEVEGKRYTHDVVIDGGKVRKRKKGPSKQFREKFGHTPLSAEEKIPWRGKRLIVGTGAHGALPVVDEVLAEAKRRGIEVIAAPTLEVCKLLEDVKKGQAYAILHCTC